ncbi:phage major tail tube protein [Teredinibacter turnerae]|uniref:phage major tail tube protein n=1 Tax=Teredinibacter turnerae TaxID=2426 RepID=UPI000364D6E2|nr:phage major tail tube protein [Teredinibacter turnerae]
MALPHKLKDFNLFGNGDSWQGKIAELALPKLTRKYEEYRGGGIDGAVEIDLGQEKIEFKWQAAWLIQSWNVAGGLVLVMDGINYSV